MTVFEVSAVANRLMLLLTAGAMAFASQAAAEVELGAIKDNRAIGNTARLTVELKVSGETASASAGSRLRIDKAVHDTGSDLTLDQGPKYNTIVGVSGKTPDQKFLILTAQLRSPARSATTLAEFSGVVEMVVPKQDPGSVITINPLKQDGELVRSEVLERVGASIKVYLKASYAAMRKGEKKSEVPVASTPSIPKAILDNAGEHTRRFLSMQSPAEDEISNRGIALEINDPKHKIANIVILGPSDVVTKPVSTSYLFNSRRELRIFELPEALSAKVRLKVFTQTDEVLVTEPFSFSNLRLP